MSIYSEAVRLAEHHIALGQTEIHIYRDEEVPDELWSMVSAAKEGGTYRLSGPTSVWIQAEHPCGLTFKWAVDLEGPDANGSGTHKFDRDRLREVMLKLPKPAVASFAQFLETAVLPPLRRRTEEVRGYYRTQMDSLDCAVGLIDYAKELAKDEAA